MYSLPRRLNGRKELVLQLGLYLRLAHRSQEVGFPLVNYFRSSAEEIFAAAIFVAPILAIFIVVTLIVSPDQVQRYCSPNRISEASLTVQHNSLLPEFSCGLWDSGL